MTENFVSRMASPGFGATLTTFIVAALVLLGGCSAAGGSAGHPASVQLIKVDAPLRNPIWIPHKNFLLAQDGSKVVRVNTGAAISASEAPGPRGVIRSGRLKDAGENMSVNTYKTGELYVPQPKLDRVALLDTKTLKEQRSIEAGEKPAWVVAQPTSDTLFVLSKDGSKVTGVDLKEYQKVFSTRVNAGRDGRVYAAEDTLDPAFWVVRLDGIAHYRGSPPERTVGRRIKVSAEAFDGDPEVSQRAYIGTTSGRVLRMEGDPQKEWEGRLLVRAKGKVGGRPEYIQNEAKEELVVYVATESKVYVMDFASLKVLDTIDYRRPLERQRLEKAKLSGMAVGDKNIYLTLRNEPYVVSIRKP